MKVLVGCECSGVVRDAFLALGHNAWSCDLKPSETPGPHLLRDVFDVLDDHWGWGLAIFHPECFGSETLVCTQFGYRKISDIVIGDMVLTHRGRYRRVTGKSCIWADETVTVDAGSLIPVVTTKEHPFLSRKRTWVRRRRVDADPQWVNAGTLDKRNFVCLVAPVDHVDVDLSHDELWLMGRYVADGSVRDSRWSDGKFESMTISVGKGKEEAFADRVSPWKSFSTSRTRTCLNCNFYGHDFVKQFCQFGMQCHEKTIPAWVLSLPPLKAESFLEGYLSGDGCFTDRLVSCLSVSKSVAIGIGVLMLRVYGKCPSIRVAAKAGTCVIEGRTCKTRQAYNAIVYNGASKVRNYVDSDGFGWSSIKSVTQSCGCFVYNLSVEEDDSYTANGIAVHNCKYLTCSAEWAYGDGPYHQQLKPGTLVGAERREAREKAIEFARHLWECGIPRIAIENPVGVLSRPENLGKPTQIIQPYEFGEDASKATCLWLKNLPPLVSTAYFPPRIVIDKDGKERQRWSNQTDSGQNRLSPSENRSADRARTYRGIAAAMAAQWSV